MNDIDNKFNNILLVLSTIISLFLLITVIVLYFHSQEMRYGINIEPEPEIDDLYDDYNPIAPTDDPYQTNEVDEPVEIYELHQNATQHQIELFEQLMTAHHQFEELGTDDALNDYASAIVRNFVADFFTLSNKDSRADVGGIQFFSSDVVDQFISHARGGFYLHLARHIEAYTQEVMPTVASTTITHSEFGTRPIENDEDSEDETDNLSTELAEPAETEYERTIIIDAEWTFAPSTLPYIEEFQTTARFLLVEVEDEGVRIFEISTFEDECEYDMFGQCIEVDPDVNSEISTFEDECEYDMFGQCIEVDPEVIGSE